MKIGIFTLPTFLNVISSTTSTNCRLVRYSTQVTHSGTCRVSTLYPAGAKLPRREHIASSVDLDALEYIANFETDPARLKVAILERVAPFCILSHHLPTPFLSIMANLTMSSGFSIYNSNNLGVTRDVCG
jgi:hypothetical protein